VTSVNEGQTNFFVNSDGTAYISPDDISRMKKEATTEVQGILNQLESDYPGITEGLASALAASVGAGGSLFALSTLGVSGLSAAGITSGLATAGSLIGGGMVAGIGVLAAPIAVLAVGGFFLAKRYKDAKLAAALGVAIGKLYDIQSRLMANAEYFREEIVAIKVTLDMLAKKKPT
jgi:hypothetical protein